MINRPKGYYTKLKQGTKGLAWTLNRIDRYCNYFEKYKNLIKWEDPRMTQFFFIVIIIVFILVTFLPIRFFLALGYCYKCWKAQFYQARRQKHNREICRIVLKNLFEDLKIKINNKKKQQMSNLDKNKNAAVVF
jgi:hypothetical protein